jgi:hypothetical protein
MGKRIFSKFLGVGGARTFTVIRSAIYLGLGLSVVAALGLLLSGGFSQAATSASLQIIFQELLRAALTFTLIAVGGGYIKFLSDNFLEEQRTKQAKLDEREAQRRSIIEAFVNTFSGFYSLRKYYEEFTSQVGDKEFKKDFLVKCTELEGQYGALKVRAIQHFELPAGMFETQKICALEKELGELDKTLKETETTIDSKEAVQKVQETARKAARVRLDLLGQYYDLWRHALRDDNPKEILAKPLREDLWRQYTGLLIYFQKNDPIDDPIGRYYALLKKVGQDIDEDTYGEQDAQTKNTVC